MQIWKNCCIWRADLLPSSRFGEALRITQDKLNSKNFYAFNPGFDTVSGMDKPNCGCQNK
ncbi:MAG: hypothetical protein HDQ99_06575 [Lachnospiraceae bacterium]|nr:hypothetical protein [Lachnospiraceae bacterium]